MGQYISIQYLGDTGFYFSLENGQHVLINPTLPTQLHADVIFVTHGNPAHLKESLAVAQRTGAPIVANEEICAYLTRQDATLKTHSITVGGELAFDWGSVVMVLSAQPSIMPDNSPGGQGAGFIFKTSGHRIYHAGNTGLFGELRFIGDFYKPNLSLLPVVDAYKLTASDITRVLAWLGSDLMIPTYSRPADETAEQQLQSALDMISFTVDHETSAIFKRLAPGDTWDLARAESSGRASGPESRY